MGEDGEDELLCDTRLVMEDSRKDFECESLVVRGP